MRRYLLALLLLLAPLAPLPFTAGCSVTAKQAAYKTLNITGTTVYKAMEAYGELVKLGQIDEQTQAAVKDLYGKYRVAYLQAVAAAEFNYESATPSQVAELAAQVVTTISTIARK